MTHFDASQFIDLWAKAMDVRHKIGSDHHTHTIVHVDPPDYEKPGYDISLRDDDNFIDYYPQAVVVPKETAERWRRARDEWHAVQDEIQQSQPFNYQAYVSPYGR